MSEPTVMTVRGPVSASQLGITLMHEHIFVNLLREFRGDGLLGSYSLAVRELNRYRDAGGRTVVEVTTAGMGRQPLALRKVSEETGLHIVAGCCLYRHQYYDAAWVDRMSTDDLAAWTVHEIEEGIDGTGVLPGIIGEIASDEYLTAQEERVFRAAARAHKKTGLAITTHSARWPVGLNHLRLLVDEEEADPRRIVVGHCDTVASPNWTSPTAVLDYHEAIAKRGAYVQFDNIGPYGEYDIQMHVRYVVNMVEKGYAKQVLLSHDTARRPHLRAYGGGGYDFILTDLVPRLKDAGLPDETIRTILVENPRRALTGA